MTSVSEQRNRSAKWSVIVPVSNVELTASVNYEFRIDRVTVVTTERLWRRRRRFGLPWRLSDLRSGSRGHFVQALLDRTPVVAVVRTSRPESDHGRSVTTLIREELAILAASQLGFAKRTQTAAPAPWGEGVSSRRSQLWVSGDGAWTQPNRRYGPMNPLRLDDNWIQFQRKAFLLKLLEIVRGQTRVARAWRDQLRKAAVLIGLSQAANVVPDAFLWNMIALELLLTEQGDNFADALPTRAEALLGWSSAWTSDSFDSKIRDAYQRRCLMVHQGDRAKPTPEDLYFTDDLLLCLLANLVGHPRIFSSKAAVARFAMRVEAERLLGVKPRVRPKSLQMFRRQYKPSDFDIY